MAAAIVSTLHAEIVYEGPPCSRYVEFRYDPADPYAVTLAIGCVVWTVARDVLADGIHTFAGLGDVEVWPNGGRLKIRLSSPDGTALLSFWLREVAAFVAACERAVPRGTEGGHINLDLEVEMLTARTDGWLS